MSVLATLVSALRIAHFRRVTTCIRTAAFAPRHVMALCFTGAAIACSAARPASAPAPVSTPAIAPAIAATAPATPAPPPAAAQNPSPMVETTRAHGRVAPHALPTNRIALAGLLRREVELHIPTRSAPGATFDLLVHFLGPSHIAVDAALAADSAMVVAVVNLSPGSSAYEQPFRDPSTWRSMVERITATVDSVRGQPQALGSVYLSAFSAGNGAVRAIIADSLAAARVRGVVILDGIHTGYLPDRRVLADSGTLDPANLQSIRRWAERAVRGEVRLLVTHSEVFPGTFASTTETADWLLRSLALSRHPVLAWGPNGMQQTSEVRAGGFALMGFAGNSAPDHLDHLHALPRWLARVVTPRALR